MNNQVKIHGGEALAQAVQSIYAEGQTDYSIEPLVLADENGKPIGRIQKNDSVIFCCRRGEREIELTEAFTDPDFTYFDRKLLDPLNFVILTLYHDKFKDLPVAFAPAKVSQTLGQVISQAGLRQLRCSESEKFAHITFFFNGGNNQPFPGEDHIRIASPKGLPFDQVPELSLPAVADGVIKGLQEGYDFILTNFANGDVIGHTSSEPAKIQCARAVDHHLQRVVEQALQRDYVIAITADHGNLELMQTDEGKPHVAHTTNLVPFILIDPHSATPIELIHGSLQDIAPTLLDVLKIIPPGAMTGQNLAPGYAWGERRKVLLIILDGWGLGHMDHTNPIHLAKTPFWDGIIQRWPPSSLQASGQAVGLQNGKAGNSEAGHMNIGAGRTVLQDDVRLDHAMCDGSFYTNEILIRAVDEALAKNSNLHLIGLLTEKSSHGSIDYPLAVLKIARDRGLHNVFLHIIFDGRSTEPGSAPVLLRKLDGLMSAIGIGQVVSGVGRGIALDRDGNYAKIKRVYAALVEGTSRLYS